MKMIHVFVFCLGEVNCAPSVAKGSGMSRDTVRSARQIAACRIHIKGMICRIKSFRFIDGPIPVAGIPLLCNIIRVCGRLTNFISPILLPKVNLPATTASLFRMNVRILLAISYLNGKRMNWKV